MSAEPKHPHTVEDERMIHTLEWVAEMLREGGVGHTLAVIDLRLTTLRADIEHRERTLRERREQVSS